MKIDSDIPLNRRAEIPFAPRRWPFFYGWVIMVATTIGTIASIPGQTMGVGVFTESLVENLPLKRLDLSTAYMIGTITSSFILPLAGWLLDRIGSRIMIVISALGLGASLILLSLSAKLTALAPTLYGSIAVMSAIFLCVRFFGQGCLTMVSRVTLGKWFNRHRGLATAIAGVFITFGFNGSPKILNWMLTNYGWQNVCVILALAVGGGMSIIGLIFYRDNPEECGLVMDGREVADEPDEHPDLHKSQQEFSLGQALRSLGFWAFSLGLCTVSLIITAVTFHISSIGAEVGLDREAAYSIFIPMSFFGIASNFISSWSSDHIKLKWMLIAMMAFQAISILTLMHFDTTWGKWLLIAGQGCAMGMFNPVSTVVFPRYFGRLHLGKISGVNLSMMVFASAIGPYLFSKGQSITDSYQEILLICLFLPVLVLVMAFWVKNPQNR